MNTISSNNTWQEVVMIAHDFGLSFKKVNSDYYKLLDYYGDEKEALDELEKYYIETIQKKTADKESSDTTSSDS